MILLKVFSILAALAVCASCNHHPAPAEPIPEAEPVAVLTSPVSGEVWYREKMLLPEACSLLMIVDSPAGEPNADGRRSGSSTAVVLATDIKSPPVAFTTELPVAEEAGKGQLVRFQLAAGSKVYFHTPEPLAVPTDPKERAAWSVMLSRAE